MRKVLVGAATLGVAAALAVGAIGTPSAAATRVPASDEDSGYLTTPSDGVSGNSYRVRGEPPYVTGPVLLSITPEGPAAVCSMQYRRQVDSSAPFEFEVDPLSPGWLRNAIEVRLCDGSRESIGLSFWPAFVAGGTLINADTPAAISVANRTDGPAAARVLTADGRAVAEGQVPAYETTEFPLNSKQIKQLSGGTVEASGIDGLVMRFPIVVANGWRTLAYAGTPEGARTFAPCSTIRWWQDASGRPAGARNIAKDIDGALQRLGRETGLRFVKARSKASADLVYRWERMADSRTGGTGGPSGRSGIPMGRVAFNSRSSWTLDRFQGFGGRRPGSGYSSAGRGWLVVHETMHALGFDHVGARDSIMAPINTGQARFSSVDLAGLRALYPKAGCN